jgi:hypothetical protein
MVGSEEAVAMLIFMSGEVSSGTLEVIHHLLHAIPGTKTLILVWM